MKRKNFKEEAKGNNQYHGQLSKIKPSLQARIAMLSEDKAAHFQSEFVHGIKPRFTLDQKRKEQMVFDACASIDVLLALIETYMVVKLQDTEFDNFEPKMHLANMKSIIDDLRTKWIRPRIRFKTEKHDDYIINEHVAQLYNMFELIAFKPTEFLEGLNVMYQEMFIKQTDEVGKIEIPK